MRIGIIGTGAMASGLGRGWCEAGHQVVFGSRAPERAVALAGSVGAGAEGGSIEQATRPAEVVVVAVPWSGIEEMIRQACWTDGRILIDCTNPPSSDMPAPHLEGSGAERIAALAPEARVVKAFNHVYAQILRSGPRFGPQNATVFYCGDDADAKETTAGLIEDLGFDPVDAGPLRTARYLEPLGGLMFQLAFIQGYGTDQALKQIRR